MAASRAAESIAVHPATHYFYTTGIQGMSKKTLWPTTSRSSKSLTSPFTINHLLPHPEIPSPAVRHASRLSSGEMGEVRRGGRGKFERLAPWQATPLIMIFFLHNRGAGHGSVGGVHI